MFTPNTMTSSLQRACLLAPFLGLLAAPSLPLFAQGSGFTYQGQLTDGGNAANGVYDFRFTVHDTSENGNLIDGPATNAATLVSNGVFTTTLNFGAAAFNGAERWLEVAVRTNTSSAAFQPLNPRQRITATPYAVRAAQFSGAVAENQLPGNVARLNSNQTFSGSVTFSNVSGSFAGNASGLTNLNAANLTGTVPDARLSANVALLNRSSQGFAGPIGIGTTNADRPLTIAGSGYAAEWISLKGTNGATAWHLNSLNNGLNIAQSAVSEARLFIATNGNVGIGTATPSSPLTVRGQIRMGANTNLIASGSVEPLRMIRGIVEANGNIVSGSGFTVTRTGTGTYTITFASRFADLPAVLLTPIGNPVCNPAVSGLTADLAFIRFTSPTGAAVEPQYFSISILGAP